MAKILMEKLFRDKNLGCHVIAGSQRILGSTSPKPEVLENARYDLFSRTVTLTLGQTMEQNHAPFRGDLSSLWQDLI